MKRFISKVSVIVCILCVLVAPLTAKAASESAEVVYDYFLGKVHVLFDWEYTYGGTISRSYAQTYTTGLGISADTSQYISWDTDNRVHFYRTIVLRGISPSMNIGSKDGFVGVGVGANLTWHSDTFYTALTAYGICNTSDTEL